LNALPKIAQRQSAEVHVRELFVRCFAEQTGDQWQAFSLEFGLAAQADSFQAVKQKLEMMIFSYVYDALVGDDRAHAYELLNRRATWQVYAVYYFYKCLNGIAKLVSGPKRIFFREPLALEPKPCAA
jgi:hypothetical protein